jgi:CheY-like chemotaxis protein
MTKMTPARMAAETVAPFSSVVRGAGSVKFNLDPCGASFESSSGGGIMLAQISASIPSITPSAVPAPGGEFPHVRKKSATRVLVVDDEPLVRWSIAETLRAHGCDIVEAGDAHTALAMVRDSATEPDAVMLDLRLPDSDDLALLASFLRLLPGVPVILMTAFGTPEVLEEARRLGAFTVLDKPFELDELDGLIERALETPRPS